jgi:hypothetical protein
MNNGSQVKIMNINLESEIRSVRRMNRLLMAGMGVLALLAAIAWRTPADTVSAKRFEVVDDAGKVWVTLEKGRIQLSNARGDSKVQLTSDESNGNLTLTGSGKKRISIFMLDEMPLVALYDSQDRMVASLPAVEK